MKNKYDPLFDHLKSLNPTEREITLTFDQIEKIINAKLPFSARTYQAWWANDTGGSHVHANAWMDAGWRVYMVNLSHQWVTFRRV